MLESADMKLVIKSFLAILASYLMLVKSGLLSAMALFWLTGLVPGTSYALPPFASTLLLIAVGLVVVAIAHPNLAKSVLNARLRSQKPVQTLPRRRYARIDAN